jgi:hypothetical protein
MIEHKMTTSLRNIFTTLLFTLLLVSCSSEKQEEKPPAHELPFTELSLDDLGHFLAPENKDWVIAGNVFMDLLKPHHCETAQGSGVVVNQPGRNGKLITALEHGDLDLTMDFMLANHSEAWLFLQGCYGLKLRDSWRHDTLSVQTSGVVEAGNNVLPALNAAKAPGLWQHLTVKFKAPRFDPSGKKVADAAFTEVTLNGKPIHQYVSLSAITPLAPFTEEKQVAPFVLVSRAGAVAFRNIRYKRYEDKKIVAADIHYAVYKGLYKEYDTLNSLTPLRTGAVDSLHWSAGDKRAQLTF